MQVGFVNEAPALDIVHLYQQFINTRHCQDCVYPVIKPLVQNLKTI
jgi:hypothetical protein